jgi:hypothetical protein
MKNIQDEFTNHLKKIEQVMFTKNVKKCDKIEQKYITICMHLDSQKLKKKC